MAKTSNYWDKRAIKRMTENEKLSEAYIERVKNIYDRAFKDIDSEIARVYKNYSKETGISVDKLKELLTEKETSKTWKTLKRQGLDKYIQSNYKSRISRLEQIQAQIYAKAKQIYTKEELENRMCYKGVVNNSYYKAVYDTQMGTGYDFSFNKIDSRLIDNLLNERWSGKNYSERIWDNTDILANTLSEYLGGALLSGQSIEKTTKQIKDRFNVSKYYAERLVRTETNHFNNEVDALAYEEMGIDKYVFVAVLDSRTSEMCQNMDNKAIDYKDREVGVNFPPLHPNCRSTTRGYLGAEDEKLLQRRARNPITGKTELIDNISYRDWAKKNGISIKPTTTPTKPKPVVENKPKQVEVKPLTKDQIDAVEYYVSGDGMYLNTYFREQDGYTVNDFNDRDKELVKDLDGALDRTIKPQTLYRSVDAEAIFGKMDEFKYQDLKEEILYKGFSGAKGQFSQNKAMELNKLIDGVKGKTFIDKGYVSTTRSEEIAQNWSGFTGSNKEIILKINTNEGVKGLDVSNLNEKLKQIELDDPQKETLLARNQSYTIGNVYAKDGHIYVDVNVGKTIPQEVVIPVKETKTSVNMTLDNLPAQLRTPKEVNNSQLFIDAINDPKADSTVAQVYKNMGKVTKYDFKVSHAKNSSLSYKENIRANTISDLKLTIPNIGTKDNLGAINTALHENMHYIDLMHGNGSTFKSAVSKLNDVVKNTSRDIGSKEIQDLFTDFNKLASDNRQAIKEQFNPIYKELNDKISKKELSYTEYKKQWSEVNKQFREASKEAEYTERNYLGGGVSNLEDIYDALSRGIYRDTDKVAYGHGYKYYSKVNKPVKEIVANYGALSITRPDLIELLRADKPQLVEALDEFMKTLL